MTYAKAFFALQLEFALRASALSGLPLARTVLEYTNFFIRFGLGRGFDALSSDDVVRLHVENAEPDGHSPLTIRGPAWGGEGRVR